MIKKNVVVVVVTLSLIYASEHVQRHNYTILTKNKKKKLMKLRVCQSILRHATAFVCHPLTHSLTCLSLAKQGNIMHNPLLLHTPQSDNTDGHCRQFVFDLKFLKIL